jgi:uncharacterized protein YbjT (DUF2867 family)
LHQVPLITSQNIAGSPLAFDVKIPMIATRDIAERAAELLASLDFSGKTVQELHGERDLTMSEATAVIAKAVGHPDAGYVVFPEEAAEEAMRQAGFSADSARLMNEMYRAYNRGLLRAHQPRDRRTTTPTSVESFVRYAKLGA